MAETKCMNVPFNIVGVYILLIFSPMELIELSHIYMYRNYMQPMNTTSQTIVKLSEHLLKKSNTVIGSES